MIGPNICGPFPPSSTIVGTPNALCTETASSCSRCTASHVDGSASACCEQFGLDAGLAQRVLDHRVVVERKPR